MLRKITHFCAWVWHKKGRPDPVIYYFAKGTRTGLTSPSDCVWLVP